MPSRPVARTIMLAAALLLPAAAAHAQLAAELALGANQGLRDDLESRESIIDSRIGAVYAVRLFKGDIREPSCPRRFGFSVITQRVKGIPEEGDNFAWNYRATFIEAEFEEVLWRGSRVSLIGGVGMGFVARSVRNENEGWNYCDTPFCNSPDFSWMVSPGLRAFVPLKGGLSLTAGVRGNIYEDAWSRYTPFRSGTMILVGISWFANPSGRPPPHVDPDGTPR